MTMMIILIFVAIFSARYTQCFSKQGFEPQENSFGNMKTDALINGNRNIEIQTFISENQDQCSVHLLSLEKRLKYLETKQNLQRTALAVEKRLNNLETKQNIQRNEFTLLNKAIKYRHHKQKVALYSAEKRTTNLKKDMENLRTKMDRMASKTRITMPIAFSAYYSGPSDFFTTNQTIVFDVELINDENGYDKSSGVFTAPISGVYMFSYYAVNMNGYAEIALSVGGKMVSAAGINTQDTNLNAMGGNVAIVFVNKDEKVKVQYLTGYNTIASWYTVGYTTFSGFLLYVA